MKRLIDWKGIRAEEPTEKEIEEAEWADEMYSDYLREIE